MLTRQFSLGEIKAATKNFEKVLGHGGEAIVYLGQIPVIGKVAVKCLQSNLAGFKEEIEIVSKIKHPHLVSLIGYCDESDKKILVYEYMGKGSLSDYIKKSRGAFCLSWQQRLDICLGAARGLLHLHTKTDELPKGIIHRDIKPENILLDDDFVAKVSDFGLCKLSHVNQTRSTIITLLKGTGGYYAPEYIQYRTITRKIDVYALGVVLFEALCRKMPWDRGDDSYYASEDEDLGLWARKNVDPEIIKETSEDCVEVFSNIIGRSLQHDPKKRPSMNDVVLNLERAIICQRRHVEQIRAKASTSVRKVSIPSSAQKMIKDIKKMKITDKIEDDEIYALLKIEDDEIYAMLKESSMDPTQTINKLLRKVRNSNKTTKELPARNLNSTTKELPARNSYKPTKELPAVQRKHVGILHVKVVNAKKLKKMGVPRGADYCVKVKLTDDELFQSKLTTVKSYSLNPEWNEEFNMVVKDSKSQVVEFYLHDWDQGIMGMNFVPLKELTLDEPKVLTLDLLKDINRNNAGNKNFHGHLLVELIYKIVKEEDLSNYQDLSNVQKAPKGTPIGGGLLVVRVHEAQDVEGTHHTNPSVRIYFKGDERRTTRVMKNKDPRWDETFFFMLEKTPINDTVSLEVISISEKGDIYSPNYKELVGHVTIRLSDVVQHKRINEKYSLTKTKAGRIHVDLQWIT